jgi:hypothetical protein
MNNEEIREKTNKLLNKQLLIEIYFIIKLKILKVMKLKSLFLSMLVAAAIVSCNNEVIGPDGPDDTGSTGASTTATFLLSFANSGGTYAGGGDLTPTGRESEVYDAALFIYKDDANGTPEAMAYLALADFGSVAPANRMVTVKCSDGNKLIYLAVNIGGDLLIKHEGGTVTNSNLGNLYVGKDWTKPGNYGPKFSVAYTDGDATPTPHEALNSAIWSGTGSTITFQTASGFSIPANTNANNLIQALTGNGTIGNGVLSGDGSSNSYYLMSNWDGPMDTGGTPYKSTCRFKLEPGIDSDASRGGSPVDTNSPTNTLKIYIQRAVAKVSVKEIPQNVLDGAGSGTSAGKLVLPASPKWAVGNINTSEYPFQVWSGDTVKSTRFNETVAIMPAANNDGYQYKMDNSRWAGTNAAYIAQTLSVTAVNTAIAGGAANQAFSPSASDNFALVTENNQKEALTHYSSFITFGGQYQPTSYITAVNSLGGLTTATGVPTWVTGTDKDTMYYVSKIGVDGNTGDGLFFWGFNALAQFVKYVVKVGDGQNTPPESDQTTIDYINNVYRAVPVGGQSRMQAYYQGYCFYRVWIRDHDYDGILPANSLLVRRNHAYRINITEIKGPGIADPNDIIPDPYNPVPIDEKEELTYVTATVEIMKWHIITQDEVINFE